MNDMRKLMETVSPLFEWDDADEFDFQSGQDFIDYLIEQGARKHDLEVEDQFAKGGNYEITLLNSAAMTIGVVAIEDGVTLDMFRDGGGEHFDSHYFERVDKAAADQIIGLMGMPLENTIGRRPY